jgi:hypothetical protein
MNVNPPTATASSPMNFGVTSRDAALCALPVLALFCSILTLL